MNLTGCFKAPTQLVDRRMGPAGGAVNLTKIDLSGGFCYVTQAAPEMSDPGKPWFLPSGYVKIAIENGHL